MPGQIVVVNIRSKAAMAFVVNKVEEPDFQTTEIEEATSLALPAAHVGLFTWLNGYYPSPVGLTSALFLPFSNPKHYVAADDDKINYNDTDPPPLTAEQSIAIDAANDTYNKTMLLHGDTGSGKTRVYIELARQAIAKGKSVLVLVPEIALSPQIVNSFEAHVPAPVRVTHSGLTPARRRKVWQSIAGSTGPQVVIGPRSSLFAPLANVGLVVMDEFHEPAYKQEQAPYYQTLRAAGKFARLNEAKFVMGSATPPVSELYIAEQRGIPIVRMRQKAALQTAEQNKFEGGDPADSSAGDLTTHIVSLKEDSERTRYPLISKTLLDAVGRALARREQSLLFLNKRGSARMVICQVCGWHAVCPRCDLTLTYHGDKHRLQCHTCGYHVSAPSICPECSSHDILFKSPGTKSIVEGVQQAFPEARIARFDKDNLKAERLEARHGEVVSGDIDIIIGTQLIAKGHDLPRLSLVGILLAETELQFPDFTSSERSYQLMYQLIGRVGRGHRAGEVVVQTYDPDNPSVQAAIGRHGWDEFYKTQLEERKLFGFPPFFYLMKIEVSRARLPTVHKTCDQIINFIQQSGEPVRISGPAPSFIEKRNNMYNWQIVVKSKQRGALTRLAAAMPAKCTVDLDPANLL